MATLTLELVDADGLALLRRALENYQAMNVATGARDTFLAGNPDRRTCSTTTDGLVRRAAIYSARAAKVQALIDQLPKPTTAPQAPQD